MEGTRVGIYDLTTMPKAQLAEALQHPGDRVPLVVPGQSVVHMVCPLKIREILSVRLSKTAYAV